MTVFEALFGTPERAARTLVELDCTSLEYCCMLDALSDDPSVKCKNCKYDPDRYGCEPKSITELEWLNQEVDE